MGLVSTGIKGTPCVQWNILLYVWCCGPKFLLEVLDILFRHIASWILSNTNKIKKWLTQKQWLKNNPKMGLWAQNQVSAMAILVLWPGLCRKRVRWTKEKKHRHGAGNLKDLEWFWMKKWSLISCQVFSNLISHCRRTFRAVKPMEVSKSNE